MKKGIKVLLIILVVLVILIGGIYALFFNGFGKSSNKGGGKVVENPIKAVVLKNTDSSGKINQEAVISEGVKEFNAEYINYILLALGVGNLHNSVIFGNPVVELVLDDQVWSSEIKDNALYTVLGGNEKKDLIITMSKQEAVKALLASNMNQFMKDSVVSGNTGIEMVAGKPALLAKGYLDMYNRLK